MSKRSKAFGGPERTSSWGRASGPKARGKSSWGGKPTGKKEERRRSRRQGWLAKVMPRRSQIGLRQYYDRMDADAARQKLAHRIAGDQRELEDLVRAASGKPLSGLGRQRIQRWLDDRSARLRETVDGVSELVQVVMSFFRRDK